MAFDFSARESILQTDKDMPSGRRNLDCVFSITKDCQDVSQRRAADAGSRLPGELLGLCE